METTKSRIAGENMRVAIVSTPRTCSSFLGNIISRKYNLQDYSEIFSYGVLSNEIGLQKLQKLKDTDNYSVKITSTSFLTHTDIISPKTFPWELFDKIILAERDDVTQQVASWLTLSHSQVSGHYDHTEFITFVTEELKNVEHMPFREAEFEYIMRDINYFHTEIKNSLLTFGDKVKVVKYELLQSNPEYYIDELNNILGTDFVIEDLTNNYVANNKTELDYTPYIDYYKLRDKIYATKEENNTTEQPVENEGIV